jgi:hypothetical protein
MGGLGRATHISRQKTTIDHQTRSVSQIQGNTIFEIKPDEMKCRPHHPIPNPYGHDPIRNYLYDNSLELAIIRWTS